MSAILQASFNRNEHLYTMHMFPQFVNPAGALSFVCMYISVYITRRRLIYVGTICWNGFPPRVQGDVTLTSPCRKHVDYHLKPGCPSTSVGILPRVSTCWCKSTSRLSCRDRRSHTYIITRYSQVAIPSAYQFRHRLTADQTTFPRGLVYIVLAGTFFASQARPNRPFNPWFPLPLLRASDPLWLTQVGKLFHGMEIYGNYIFAFSGDLL